MNVGQSTMSVGQCQDNHIHATIAFGVYNKQFKGSVSGKVGGVSAGYKFQAKSNKHLQNHLILRQVVK